MMRFSVSTWNVLKMLGMWDRVRPYNFMFMVMTSPKLSFDFDFENKPDDKPMVIVPFTSRQEEWSKLEGIDSRNKNRRGKYRRYRLDDPGFHPLTYGHMIEEYIRHPEAKSLGPDGTPCTAETRGLLQRVHITAGRIRYIDKETSSMWAQSDDLSVVTDEDEIGFRVVEYGKSRKVVLPDSLKRQIQGTKLQRVLRRRGEGLACESAREYLQEDSVSNRRIQTRESARPRKESLCHTKTRSINANGRDSIANKGTQGEECRAKPRGRETLPPQSHCSTARLLCVVLESQ